MSKMTESRLGIFSWFGYELPLRKRILLIHNAGFQATSLWWGHEEDFEDVAKDQTAALVRDTGLYLENIHAPYEDSNDLWSPDSSIREKAIHDRLEWIEDCARYQIPIFVMHATKGSDLPGPTRFGMESIDKIVKAAEKMNIILALENTQRVDYLDMILTEFDTPALGLCYDTSHAWIGMKSQLTVLNKWKHRLVNLHLSDNDGQDDQHWLPGEGIIDWVKVGQSLPDQIPSGCLMLEVFPKKEEAGTEPEIFLQKAYKRVQWVHHLCPE
jgi:sugar phosphate isomerase/epimerase